MKARPEDRLQDDKSGKKLPLLIVAVAVVVVIFGVFLIMQDESPPAPTKPQALAPPEPAPPRQPELSAVPDIPEPEPVVEEEVVPEPVVPPVTLETSDGEIRATLAQAGASEQLLAATTIGNLVPRSGQLIDGLSRGVFLRKLLPVKPPAGKFATQSIDDQLYIDPKTYSRYDAQAQAIAELDTPTLVASFHRLRPLLEQAYAGTGQPAGDFDNAVIRALDLILAVPELDQPIPLKQEGAVFRYQNPQLEKLTALQKQVLRMGPKNTARIKQQARALRAGLLGSDS